MNICRTTGDGVRNRLKNYKFHAQTMLMLCLRQKRDEKRKKKIESVRTRSRHDKAMIARKIRAERYKKIA